MILLKVFTEIRSCKQQIWYIVGMPYFPLLIIRRNMIITSNILSSSGNYVLFCSLTRIWYLKLSSYHLQTIGAYSGYWQGSTTWKEFFFVYRQWGTLLITGMYLLNGMHLLNSSHLLIIRYLLHSRKSLVV